MTLVSLEHVERRFGDLVVLEDVGLRIEEKDRVGVVGDNGAGKTTLIKILAGVDAPDRGARNARRGLRVAYGAQIPDLPRGTTVLAWVLAGSGDFQALEGRIRELEARLAEVPHDERALDEYGHLQSAFEAGGGYQRQALCEKVLSGLGFDENQGDFDKDTTVLSGGEKSRLQLAALMTAPADLLILDEPTNHLDLQGIEFLESYLPRWPGAVVVVSHDRRFLDNVAQAIVEVDAAGVSRFKGNYTAWRKQRDANLLAAARAYKSQQEYFEKEMDFIRRNMAGRMSVQAKGRLKRLQRLERLSSPRGERGSMRLEFKGGRGQQGQAVLEVEDVAARLPDGRTLFSGATFRLWHGEVLGVLGRNGAGKTTLLRMLAGERPPSAGKIARAPSVRAGYFSQEMHDLPQSGTVLDALRALDPTVLEGELRSWLALFLFTGDDVLQPVQSLSGGEKRRLALARLTRGRFDYLCLDEPTNHLDIGAREGLEEALLAYPGAAVVISHDREFLEAVTSRVLWVEDGRVQVFEGGLEQCMAALGDAQRQRRSADAAAAKPAPAKGSGPDEAPAAPRQPSGGKVRNPMLFEKLEGEIIAMEEELERLRHSMLLPDNYGDQKRMRALLDEQKALEQRLRDGYERWENWT